MESSIRTCWNKAHHPLERSIECSSEDYVSREKKPKRVAKLLQIVEMRDNPRPYVTSETTKDTTLQLGCEV
ncbi:hypothetical protein M514_26724 [Trichuris suis]|uniref:Uncharacterized protein n=1 Tax=Trichuris suis TaxID=68888 RepID=A0A085MV36_9BILA|nr:hypothetical protein M514_26724 [Trichuris suis]